MFTASWFNPWQYATIILSSDAAFAEQNQAEAVDFNAQGAAKVVVLWEAYG